MKLATGEVLRAEAILVDGDRSGRDRWFVMMYLDDELVAESRELSFEECKSLAKRINGVNGAE